MENQEGQLLEKQRKKYNLAFGKINGKNIELFRLLTTLTLPVQYSDHFYYKILNYKEFSLLGFNDKDQTFLLAFYNDILVGAITCREEEFEGENTVYIMTFGVIDAYRRLGFGSQILEEMITLVRQKKSIKAIYLHMWVKNETGYQFYLKHGFIKHQDLENYYQDIEPPHCYILKKIIE